MQTIKQWKHSRFLDFLLLFGLLIVKIYFSFLFEIKFDKVLKFNIVHFPNFEMSASLLLALPSSKRPI